MNKRALVKVSDLPKDTWENPEWTPSQDTMREGVNNYGKLLEYLQISN